MKLENKVNYTRIEISIPNKPKIIYSGNSIQVMKGIYDLGYCMLNKYKNNNGSKK